MELIFGSVSILFVLILGSESDFEQGVTVLVATYLDTAVDSDESAAGACGSAPEVV